MAKNKKVKEVKIHGNSQKLTNVQKAKLEEHLRKEGSGGSSTFRVSKNLRKKFARLHKRDKRKK
jgi:hypothetical protein